jgi:hypothetical protein
MERKVFIFLTLILFSNFAFAEKDSIYFSFERKDNVYFVGIEGYIYENNKKYNLENLNYEWTINYLDTFEEFKTYKPVLSFTPKNPNFSGKVKIYPNDNSFFKEYSFSFNLKSKPVVSIVRFLKDLNIILPFKNYTSGELLFPLTFNFSSDNLSYAWKVGNKLYSSVMIDPSDIYEETEITLYVKNLDSNEFAVDKIIFKQ